ncbi:MAG: BatA domain-containing protein [Pirellula sp.]|jgi:hypothetical protein|nr:BatA domain-containing protein [Pirellula sp.]
MQFLFQPLAWGFLLVLVPLLIHLINMVRHRRTEWAAMEFLMESYRKHRRWVWLKQALLIASRMLAVAIAVAMLAQWVSGSKWLSWVSQSTTHHYFILDDSASMGDTGSGGNAYQGALGAIQTILNAAPSREGNHLVSVIRTSRAFAAQAGKRRRSGEPEENSSEPTVTADSVADLLARSVPSDPSSMLSRLMGTQPSAIDAPLHEAIALMRPVMEQSIGEKAVVYLLSDYRVKDWQSNANLQQELLAIPKNDSELQLIDCSPVRHENLTIASIVPQQEVLVAGVPALINITVRNEGISPVRNVTVRVLATDYSSSDLEPKPTAAYSGLTTELPPLLIDRIEPGESVTRHTQVLFPKSGSHVVEAQLPPDPLQADNRAHCVLDLQDGLRVLLIDGDPSGKHSFFIESALNPGGSTKTGLLMAREGPEFLRDADPSALDSYACILMQAVPGLDGRAMENLHAYVARGGGLAVFFGELMTDADYARYNANWTKAPIGAPTATPLMPFRILGMSTLARSSDSAVPDLIAEQHPIFEPLLGLSNSPFQFVRVDRFVDIDESLFGSASESGESTTKTWKKVLALRNQKPLMIDHSVGSGRVLFTMTALDRQWTNWPQDPTFVVAALKMVGYLSSFRGMDTSKVAGTLMRWDFSSQEMLPEIQVVCPPLAGSTLRPILSINAAPSGESSLAAVVDSNQSGETEESIRAILNAGVYEWWGTSTQGDRVIRNIARNVSPLEGAFEKVSNPDLNRELSGIPFTYKSVESVGATTSLAGFANRNMLLMIMLLSLLLFEQWLAWSASYHLPSK